MVSAFGNISKPGRTRPFCQRINIVHCHRDTPHFLSPTNIYDPSYDAFYDLDYTYEFGPGGIWIETDIRGGLHYYKYEPKPQPQGQ